MKNVKIASLFIALLLSSSLFGDNEKLKAQIDELSMIKKIGAKVTQVIDHGTVYQFKAEIKGDRPAQVEAFLTKDFNTLMIGKAYNPKTGAELSIPFAIDADVLKSVAAYKTGNGKNEYFVFTDPECPYCQKLENQLTLLKSDVTVYTILFPLSFHKNAKSMSRYILNQKDDIAKAKAMKDIAQKSAEYAKANYETAQLKILNDKIQKSLDEATKIGINGTPTILSANGVRVSPDALLAK